MFPEAKYLDVNGIRMAVYAMGSGPAIIMVHGFPELAYSWRYQLPALAAAGYQAIAPDMRGYGQTDAPTAVDAYQVTELVADLTGLLDALDLETAIFVGHDWGAMVLWHMAMLAPERIEKLVILNIPHVPRPSEDPIEIFRQRLGEDFYIVNFQDSDEADKRFAEDPGHFFDIMMRKNQIARRDFDKLPATMQSFSMLKAIARDAASGDPLLNAEERAYYVDAYTRSGFSGPINWYRNWTKNWHAMEGVDTTIEIPTLFIGAVDDVVVPLQQIEAMRPLVTQLEVKMLEPCGHWTQQERPDDVNKLMVEWLNDAN